MFGGAVRHGLIGTAVFSVAAPVGLSGQNVPSVRPATAESVAIGEYLYQLNCLVCHGVEGRGDGPVGMLLETSPVDMHLEYTQDQADGQLFFTITRGRVTMPYYRDALSQEERWHVINYIRAEFGSE